MSGEVTTDEVSDNFGCLEVIAVAGVMALLLFGPPFARRPSAAEIRAIVREEIDRAKEGGAMKREVIISLGLLMALLAIVVLIVVYVPKSEIAIPRSEDNIRRIVREEMERAKENGR